MHAWQHRPPTGDVPCMHGGTGVVLCCAGGQTCSAAASSGRRVRLWRHDVGTDDGLPRLRQAVRSRRQSCARHELGTRHASALRFAAAVAARSCACECSRRHSDGNVHVMLSLIRGIRPALTPHCRRAPPQPHAALAPCIPDSGLVPAAGHHRNMLCCASCAGVSMTTAQDALCSGLWGEDSLRVCVWGWGGQRTTSRYVIKEQNAFGAAWGGRPVQVHVWPSWLPCASLMQPAMACMYERPCARSEPSTNHV